MSAISCVCGRCEACARWNGGPAFPTDSEHQPSGSTWHFAGMSLRDYFAAKAMQGLLVSPTTDDSVWDEIVALSYDVADAMLRARSTTTEGGDAPRAA